MASNTLQEFTASPQGINGSDREALINFNAYREGILVAFGFRNLKILYTNVDEILGRDVFNISKALVSVQDSQTITKSQQRLFQRANKDDMPTVGVEHLQQLLGFDNNCSLDYVFTRAYLDSDVFFTHDFGIPIFDHLDIGHCNRALWQANWTTDSMGLTLTRNNDTRPDNIEPLNTSPKPYRYTSLISPNFNLSSFWPLQTPLHRLLGSGGVSLLGRFSLSPETDRRNNLSSSCAMDSGDPLDLQHLKSRVTTLWH
ncbi:hypothetical protein A0O28_0013060 [Trichoderma guizhouense]|uniref:Uncharacterized protein n=1 Tax=Trichoderma guizhouense TaxID=1491466 RepID=A0A1T3CAV8_9HYPO|nr:hypothetical protein A0O28_0013060 [Trichoderma guizhouense]